MRQIARVKDETVETGRYFRQQFRYLVALGHITRGLLVGRKVISQELERAIGVLLFQSCGFFNQLLIGFAITC